MSLLIGSGLKSAFHVESDPSRFDTSANTFCFRLCFYNDLFTIGKIRVHMLKKVLLLGHADASL